MEIKLVDLTELKQYEKNPRHNDVAVDKVADSIKEFGFKNPIIVDKDGVIIAGHTRYKAAQKLGIIKVPVIYATDLSEDQVKAYRIADNKLNELAEWDFDLLAQELEGLGLDPTLTGFEKEEIDKIMADFFGENEVEEDDFNEDQALEEVEKNPKTKPGDMWRLGRHTLFCGDSTKKSDVLKLMGGTKARLIITDPPYNVNYEGGTGLKIENDNMDSNSFYEFLFAAFEADFEIAEEGCGIYVFHADTEGENFRRAYREAGWKLSECLVWVKSSLVLGRQDYHWRHEPCLYGWKEGAAHHFYGGRAQDTVIDEDLEKIQKMNKKELLELLLKVKEDLDNQSSVIRFDKPSRSSLHPTMKPLGLIGKIMTNSSQKGDVIVDTFGGSGSTLIAAEQIGRTAYTMEIDPKYVDVIVNRYIEFVEDKNQIKLIRGGKEYNYSDI